METTNYAYITKLVKICDQLLGPCRPSNLSSPSGQYGTLFHVLSWSCHLCRHLLFFLKECNLNQFKRCVHIVCPKKVGKCSNQKKTSPRNIRVQESTLTFLGPGCFVYHIWSCQLQRQKKTDECCKVTACHPNGL